MNTDTGFLTDLDISCFRKSQRVSSDVDIVESEAAETNMDTINIYYSDRRQHYFGLPMVTFAPTPAIIVKTSEGKLSWSWVSIRLPAQDPTFLTGTFAIFKR